MKREYEDYINDILEAMLKSQEFIREMNIEQFRNDDKSIFAVIRALEIIGEATKHIPDNIRKQNNEIPWKDMAGMRDVLIHDYFGVDVETVWLTVTEKIPEIQDLITKIFKKQKNNE